MSKFRFVVTVETDTQDHASVVLRERIDVDEPMADDAGNAFDYSVAWTDPLVAQTLELAQPTRAQVRYDVAGDPFAEADIQSVYIRKAAFKHVARPNTASDADAFWPERVVVLAVVAE